jgi:hypothetical protein
MIGISYFYYVYIQMMKTVIATKAQRVIKKEDERLILKLNRKGEMP